jgi:hypothetical protein
LQYITKTQESQEQNSFSLSVFKGLSGKYVAKPEIILMQLVREFRFCYLKTTTPYWHNPCLGNERRTSIGPSSGWIANHHRLQPREGSSRWWASPGDTQMEAQIAVAETFLLIALGVALWAAAMGLGP